jgi:hypothetical protein
MEATREYYRGSKFLRFSRLLSQFIKAFSSLTTPLTRLLHQNVSFVWNDKCERSFQELKRRLVTALVLNLSEEGKAYVLYIDTSKEGLGAVLI